MSIVVRVATVGDIDAMIGLLLADAVRRQATDPVLWRMKADASEQVSSAISIGLRGENAPFRQQWLVAESDGTLVGLMHTILLPIPPIYAGELGAPGLIMEDSFVAENAPAETSELLLKAAEADLFEAGAGFLLASSVAGGAWEPEYAARNYKPLTLYMAATGLPEGAESGNVGKALAAHVPSIVTLSARNRQILFGLNEFWKPHAEADPRFARWMERSLTLSDRDMFVAGAGAEIAGYAIAQPAGTLHFPPAHDIGAVGFIDDFYHCAFEDPARLDDDGQAASHLLSVAEAALAGRGNDAVLVVCPAAWTSKKALLEATGHRIAIVWHIKL